MSSVETGQMSAVETGQTSAAETGPMSAVETRQMCSIKTGRRPVAIVDICLVSTCTSKDRKAHERLLVNCSMQDGTNREAVSWKLSAAFSWWLLVILNVFVFNILLKNACKNHQTHIKNSRIWSQHGPKTSPKLILERLWRPLGSHPWNKVLPRLHVWWFWLHFGTPFGTSLRSCWASLF